MVWLQRREFITFLRGAAVWPLDWLGWHDNCSPMDGDPNPPWRIAITTTGYMPPPAPME